LVIDTDAPLPCAITLERFEPIAARHAQIVDPSRRVQQTQFA
jgi:hypothetical protein